MLGVSQDQIANVNNAPSDPSKNVYVASLPMAVDDQQLHDLFAPYGPITSARIMRAKGTHVSKGYGFVLYKEAHSAARAIAALHGQSVLGSRIQVRLANADASTAFGLGPQPSTNSLPPVSTCSPIPVEQPIFISQDLQQQLTPPQQSVPVAGGINMVPVGSAQPQAFPTHPLSLIFNNSPQQSQSAAMFAPTNIPPQPSQQQFAFISGVPTNFSQPQPPFPLQPLSLGQPREAPVIVMLVADAARGWTTAAQPQYVCL